MSSIKIPVVIAHRGNSSKFPENSTEAISSAVELGADMIEIDIHLTKDGEIVVHHDNYLGRTCQGPVGRTTCQVSSLTLNELKQCPLLDKQGNPCKNLTMPTLSEVLQLIRGRTKLLIEIKHERISASSALCGGPLFVPYDLTTMIGKLQEALAPYPDASEWIYIQAFALAYLDEIKSHADPRINSLKLFRLSFLPGFVPILTSIGQALFCIRGTNSIADHPIVDTSMVGQSVYFSATFAQFVKHVKKRQKAFYVWTVNSPDQWVWCYKNGVDGIITDSPEDCKAVLKAVASSS